MGHKQYFEWGNIEWMYEPDTNNPISRMHIGISTILPGKRQKEHIHYGDEQLLYVLSGRGEQIVENILSIKEPGSMFHINAGSIHEAINTGEEPIKELLISVPVDYNKYNSLNNILNTSQLMRNFDNEIVLDNKIKELYLESKEVLGIPIAIFNKINEPIILSEDYPEFCIKTCKVNKDIRNCSLYNNKEEYKPPHYKDQSAFVCEYGLRVFVMPIIIDNTLIGTIKGGHVKVYDKSYIKIENRINPDDELYNKIQILHQGRIVAILQHIKTLSNNISYHYLLENTELELTKKNKIIKEIEENKNSLKEDLKNTKGEVLSIQINNHFLFNTLNAIASLAIKEDNFKTYESIVRLSKIFRYSLHSSNAIATLNDEVLFITDYLELQKLRYGERLNIKVEVDKDIGVVRIPFNFMQPVIENSFIHGFKNMTGNLDIGIHCIEKEGKIHIHITDNGIGIGEKSVGLNNKIKGVIESDCISGLMFIYKKLELLYRDNFEFEIFNNKTGGTIVNIILPKDC